ncbi:MAG: amino acid adenylation domain-containing protein [Candidatus Hydrogenedentes bacterium]|nr:amino acid adenylation domain-containing protein [Candidatus Hydrogenedentota bacterium]
MREGMLCLHEIFEQRVVEGPDRPAVTFEGETLTYDALNRRANQLAHLLRARGVGRETLVGLCLERSFDTVTAILAVHKAGAAYVPMDPSNPPERVRMIVEDAQCPVVIILEAQRHRFTDSSTLIALDDTGQPWEDYPETNPEPVALCDELAYVIYTSGSTGRPKGVPIAHRNVTRLFTSTAAWFDFSARDTWTLFHSFAFDFSVWEIWGALLHGGRLVVVPYWLSRSPDDFHRLLVEEGVTVLNQTPSAFAQLQAVVLAQPEELPRPLELRYVIFGGENLSYQSLAPWFERHGDENPQMINMYGITETTIHVTYRRVRQHEAVPGTPSYIGVPIPDQPCHVVTRDGLIAEIGEEGELYVGGAGNARGYMNRPDLTAERFISSPFPQDNGAILYKSGDLVRRLDGDMVYLGRIDRQVQLRGFRVELGEIENALVTFEGVQGAAALPHTTDQGDLRLVAYYVSTLALPVASLREHMTRSLPDYMVPSAFIRIDTMPLTGNGKTDYRALPEPVFERGNVEYVAPDSEVERKLASLWQELLQVPVVGADDNFFALGGHSLLATRLLLRIQEAFGVRLSLRNLYEAPSLVGIAESLGRISHDDKAVVGTEFPLAARSLPLPSSFAQERLWFIEHLDPGNSAYIIPILFEINGAVDLPKLRKSVEAVVSRHEVLRTTFQRTEEGLFQLVKPESDVTFHVLELNSTTEDEDVANQIRADLSKTARNPMNLEKGPLAKFFYYTHRTKHSFLGLIVHHTLFDGWSISVLLKDLADAYTSYDSDAPHPLAPLQYQYADYSHWQRSQYTSGALQHQLSYWKQQLAAPLPVLEIPTDFPRPPRQTWKGAVARGRVDDTGTTKLEQLALDHHTTTFTVLIAAWQLLLHRYSGQQEIVIGCASAGRNHPAMEEMIGFFVNTVALRTQLADYSTLTELLGGLNTVVLDALEHQDLPFDRVVAEVREEQDPSRAPIFQVMFVLHNTPSYEASFCDLQISGEELSNGCAKFDLSLTVQPRHGELLLNLEYNTSLFLPETAARMLRSYETLLKSILENPGGRLGDFQIVDGPERTLLLETWTDTAYPLDRTLSLHRLFEARAAELPDCVAVADDETSLTYGELNARANQLAHYLLARGVAPEEPVPFFLGRTVRVMVAIIGILKAGAAYVPLDLLDPPARRGRVLSVLTPRLLLTESELAPQLNDVAAECVCLDGPGLLEDLATDSPGIGASGENLAYVIFTSGSTGEPKGVCCTHQGVINLYQDLQSRLPIGPGDACSIWTAFSFDVSVYESWTSLLAGATLHIIPERVRANPEACLEWLRAREVVTGYIPGFMLPTLLETQRRAPLPWRRLLVGVEPLSEALLSDIVEATPGLVLLNLYGPTEAAIYVTLYQAHDTHPRPTGNAPIGKAIHNTRIYVLDPAMNPVPVGVPGELYIGGVGLARGYYNAPELTARQFVPDPFTELDSKRLYRTGDLVYFKGDGNIQFVRRMDRYIKLRGYRIEPGEIESALREFPGVDDAVLLLNEKGSAGPRLVAYLATQNPDTLNTDHLADFLKGQLPAHMCPAQFVPLARFPRTVQGKLDRKALPEPSSPSVNVEASGPRNECERVLLEIWHSCLDTHGGGIHSDFFTLGGHSLLAVKVLDRVNRRWGSTLTLSDFFDNPTVAGLAGKLGARSGENEPLRGIQLREVKSGIRIPFFCLPGAGDSGGIYDAYAEALSSDQPFWGFSNLDADLGGPNGIEEVARRCIEGMKMVRPAGPYYLGGFSFGGTLAYEMARQLIEAGEEVPFIAVIDGSTTDHYRIKASLSKLYLKCLVERIRARCHVLARTWKLHVGYLRDGIGLFARRSSRYRDSDLPPLRLSEFLRWIWVDASVQYYFIQAGLSKPTISERRVGLFLDQLVRSRTKVMRSSRQAIGDYRMVPIQAEITLFRAQHNPYKSERRDPTYGWGRIALKGVRIVEVPGNHMAMIRPPYATGLGQALQRMMDALESRDTPP